MTQARYFDGKSARAHVVAVTLPTDSLVLSGADGAVIATLPIADLKVVDDGMSATPLTLTLHSNPDCRLVFLSPEVGRAIIERLPRTSRARVRIGASWASLSAWALAAGIAGAAIYNVFPQLVAPVTALIPYTLEKKMGDELISGVAMQWEVCTDADGQAALDKMFERLLPETDPNRPFQVRVLSSEMVNAFAAPGNHVVVFDGLISKAETPDEVAGVLAHEIGHQLKRHPMSGLVRSVGATFLMGAVFGGVTPEAVTTWGATLYTLRFGRDAEREADAIAIDLLTKANISPVGFRDFFKRINETPDETQDEDSDDTAADNDGASFEGMLSYLSTHPPTDERIAAVDRALTSEAKTTPALSDAEWAALKGVCKAERRHAARDEDEDEEQEE
jgi:predicted Zn-dependent protease